jgi:hypothetical protein
MGERNATSYFLRLDRRAPTAPAPRDTVGDQHGAPTGLIALRSDERVLWQGQASVCEVAGDEPGERWSLPPSTQVTVTDRRVAYALPVRPAPAAPPSTWPPHRTVSPIGVPAVPDGLASGEVRWLWPHELRVRPGPARAFGRAAGTSDASPAQVMLVCETAGGERPTLVFSGGDLAALSAAEHLANLMRRAIAQFRLDNAATLELSTPHARMLSRLLIGPEFVGQGGGAARSVALAAALWMARPGRSAPAAELAARLAVTGIPGVLRLDARTQRSLVA